MNAVNTLKKKYLLKNRYIQKRKKIKNFLKINRLNPLEPESLESKEV